jgi:hypothetical protein
MEILCKNNLEKILLYYKKADESFIIYNNAITKIQVIHTTLLNKNIYNFVNYSLHLDLLYFNKQILENENIFFNLYKQNCLKRLYQDLYILLKQLVKTLYQFEKDITEKDFNMKKMENIIYYNNIKTDIDFNIDTLAPCINLINEYFNNFKHNIDNFNNFIETNCLDKKDFDIKNVIVNLNTQSKKFTVEYDGLINLFVEILASHLIIASKFTDKLNFFIKLINDFNTDISNISNILIKN